MCTFTVRTSEFRHLLKHPCRHWDTKRHRSPRSTLNPFRKASSLRSELLHTEYYYPAVLLASRPTGREYVRRVSRSTKGTTPTGHREVPESLLLDRRWPCRTQFSRFRLSFYVGFLLELYYDTYHGLYKFICWYVFLRNIALTFLTI